jgi:hypothetical protein
MFTWINKQAVRSDEGFEFWFTGRFSAEYREDGRVMDVAVEGSGPLIDISLQSLRWRNHDRAPDEHRRIADNIRRACEFQKLFVVFV